MAIILLAISIALGTAGHLLAKAATDRMNEGTFILQLVKNPIAYLAIAAFGLSFLFWFAYLRGRPLSLTVPLSSLTYVLVAVFSRIIYNEQLLPRQWAGIAVVILGVTLLGK